ncbi:MAG: hypothetical protein GEU97_13465 [Actinophytocola sp.]|nr:hypothetical protein [Actinophytocola sp.]
MRTKEAVERLREIATGHDLRLVVLYGSRARGDAHTGSDWDIGYVPSTDVDHLSLLRDITEALTTDAVDVTDLSRASGLLRFRAASEGVVVWESTPGAFHDFAVAAALHWYDVEPTVRQAHDELLAGMS